MRLPRVPAMPAALAALALLAACRGRIDPALAYTAMPCPNFTLEREPLVIAVPPEGNRVLLGPSRSWVAFPAGALADTARYRITRAMRGDTVLVGFVIEPLDGAPLQLALPAEVRLNYSKCMPRPASPGRGLLWHEGAGESWVVLEGSRRRWTRAEVSGQVRRLAAFAVAM